MVITEFKLLNLLWIFNILRLRIQKSRQGVLGGHCGHLYEQRIIFCYFFQVSPSTGSRTGWTIAPSASLPLWTRTTSRSRSRTTSWGRSASLDPCLPTAPISPAPKWSTTTRDSCDRWEKAEFISNLDHYFRKISEFILGETLFTTFEMNISVLGGVVSFNKIQLKLKKRMF